MKNNKIPFLTALIVALIIFWSGILIGIFFEDSRVAEITKFYSDSETSISDFELSSELIFSSNISCELLSKEGRIFADRIYKEAKKLENYDDANKITDRVVHLHKRYDLLRTLLWKNIIKNKKDCEDSVDTIIYFYKYLTKDIGKISTQDIMSNYLIKIKKGNPEIILIPIATDTGIVSIEILQEIYNVTEVPSILINEKYIIKELKDLSSIETFLS
tara:strand:- start:2991 stop:3641 length:651 start_codon:yes stop_codon:yes gene_type:complete